MEDVLKICTEWEKNFTM